MEKEDLAKLDLSYELFYTDYYCDSFKSLTAAIKRAKDTIKWNPECKGGYSIRLKNTTTIIAVY